MATITSLGVGSGLDLENLVSSLMQVERRPLTALQNQVKSYNAKISALGTLSSKLSALQTAAKGLTPATLQTPLDKFATFKASVADTAIASASAGPGAVAGSYSLEVDQLARNQKLTTAAFPGGASSSIATGTLTIDFGSVDGGVFTADPSRQASITITSENNTLAGLRNAINQANIGLSATIVNGTGGARLVISGQDGANQAFALSGLSGFEFDPADPSNGDFPTVQAAQDAMFSLNGIAATSHSNTVTGVIDGVTLTLTKETAPSTSTTLTVTRDNTTKLRESLDAFIKAYNDAVSTMKSQGAYNTETKTAGPLQGNSVLRNAETTLRNLIFDTTAGGSEPYQRLSDLGVGFAADGTLKVLDDKKLENAITANAASVAGLVAKVGKAFDESIERVVGLSGSIKISTDSMNTMIRDLNKRQEALETRLVTIEARYRKQFSALDTLMSNMSKTSSYLAQQLSNLPKLS
ncbi:MAG: flagellar filament capping protein FliD [Azovibrio sp.]|nr:flagellar filament capping protein FliD [Azovibrio sp.]